MRILLKLYCCSFVTIISAASPTNSNQNSLSKEEQQDPDPEGGISVAADLSLVSANDLQVPESVFVYNGKDFSSILKKLERYPEEFEFEDLDVFMIPEFLKKLFIEKTSDMEWKKKVYDLLSLRIHYLRHLYHFYHFTLIQSKLICKHHVSDINKHFYHSGISEIP